MIFSAASTMLQALVGGCAAGGDAAGQDALNGVSVERVQNIRQKVNPLLWV